MASSTRIVSFTRLGSSFYWNFIILMILVIYALGIAINVQEPDGAVYAHISMEMAESGNWMDIIYQGKDWLDKPHYQFWVTALSFKLAGINNFAYKIPAILFSLLGAVFTYLYGKRFYNRRTGAIAALFLMTAQHIILSNQDVRAEPFLTGLTIFSLYFFAAYLQDKKVSGLILGCLGLAMLLMTKGLFTILPIVSAVFFVLLLKKDWKEMFNWQWLVAGLLTLLLISPTLIAYFQQFDLHPEKVVFDKTGVSGIRFFFWDSQWGRFTNTGPIQGQGDPTFFIHTLLWAFAPWAFIGYYALYSKTKSLFRGEQTGECYSYFGFMTLFLLFSVSKFQLPHYINAILPLLAIVSADTMINRIRKLRTLKVINGLQLTYVFFGIVLIIFLQVTYFDKAPKSDTMLLWALCLVILLVLYLRPGHLLKKIIFAPAVVIVALNYYLNRDFYPHVLQYQSESEVVRLIRAERIPLEKLFTYDQPVIITNVYLKTIVPALTRGTLMDQDLAGKFIFTSAKGLSDIASSQLDYRLIGQLEDFPVTTLTYEFVNKHTRSKAVRQKYLVQILPQ